jgi:hypothetical protein
MEDGRWKMVDGGWWMVDGRDVRKTAALDKPNGLEYVGPRQRRGLE